MCTNITIQRISDHYPLISARTMDFTIELPTSISFVPRHQSFPEAPLPKEIRWKNKYGFIGMMHSILGQTGYSDGLNEAGLSAASLWLDHSTYKKPESNVSILSNHNVVSYALGNFRSIDEVKEALSKVTVVDIEKPFRIPLHFIFSDASGKHLIIEFINGEMKTYNNNVGVLTNDPTFDWHLGNLRNYENLSLKNSKPRDDSDEEMFGSGQFGSPGDPGSPSRFIRAELLSRSLFKPQNTQESIGLAQQILQTLAVPCGTVMINDSKTVPKAEFDWTQWSVIRDHTNRSIYFYTAFNSRLYGIHLSKLDFKKLKPKKIEMIHPKWYVDITNNFES